MGLVLQLPFLNKKNMKPIDYVVPMVFTDDKQWQEAWSKFSGEPASSIRVFPRWRSWGTEELLVKCITAFMPWVRYIHILLFDDSQVQPWMEDNPKVKVVFHRDFIPEEYRPCFVSRTIEMFIKDIPNLSEQFIYGNDDMYPIAPLKPTDFFRKGKPCQHMDESVYIRSPYVVNIFMEACVKGLNMVARDFGKEFDETYLYEGHSINAILKSTCKTIWSNHEEEILGSIYPERTKDGLNQYIYPYYQHLSGNYVDYTPHREIVSLSNTPDEVRDAFKSAQVVCVNDNDDWVCKWWECAAVVREELTNKLTEEEYERRRTETGTAKRRGSTVVSVVD